MTQPQNPANNLPDLPVLVEVVDQQSSVPVLTDIVTNSATPLSTAELQQLLRTLSADIETKLQAELEMYAKTLTRQIIKRTLAELRNDPVALQQALNKAALKGIDSSLSIYPDYSGWSIRSLCYNRAPFMPGSGQALLCAATYCTNR